MGLSNYLGVIFYTIIFVYYMFSFKSSAIVGKKVSGVVPDNIRALGQFKFNFFTIWTFVLQTVFLATAILDESSKLLNLPLALQKRLGRTRAFLFNTFVFPCSLVVVTIFWTLWHIDRELIFPRAIDEFFPLWLNHTMHTFILVPLLIELSLPKKHNFVGFQRASVIVTAYAVFYQLLFMSIYVRYGVWLYPIYGVLSWTQRILFSLFQLVLILIFQKIGIVIQDSKRMRNARKIA